MKTNRWRALGSLCLLVAAVLPAAWATEGRTETATGTEAGAAVRGVEAGAPARGPGPVLGVAAHLGGAPRSDVDRQVALARQARFKLVRWEIQWKHVEQDKGELQLRPEWRYTVERIRSAGLDSILILDYGNPHYDRGDKPRSPEAIAGFARYAGYLASQFKGQVKYYQVWNEWNSRIGKTSRGNAADYAALARATHAAVKAADPQAQVIVGGFSSSSYDSLVGYGDRETTFEDLLKLDVAAFGDVLALHPYTVYRSADWNNFEGYDRLLTTTMKRIRATPGLATMPVFITEIGWSTSDARARGVSAEAQADYLKRALDRAAELGVEAVVVYELRDGNTDAQDTEGNFGLLDRRATPKPAYQMLESRR